MTRPNVKFARDTFDELEQDAIYKRIIEQLDDVLKE